VSSGALTLPHDAAKGCGVRELHRHSLRSRNKASREAFSVVSLILSSLITFLLLCHWGFEFKQNRPDKGPTDDQLTMRVAGRHFMLNVTLFVVDLALLALLGSRVVGFPCSLAKHNLIHLSGALDVPTRHILRNSHANNHRFWARQLLHQACKPLTRVRFLGTSTPPTLSRVFSFLSSPS
jgi:hypothetical protein